MLVVEKCSNFFIVVNRPSAKLRILLLQFNVECLAGERKEFPLFSVYFICHFHFTKQSPVPCFPPSNLFYSQSGNKTM